MMHTLRSLLIFLLPVSLLAQSNTPADQYWERLWHGNQEIPILIMTPSGGQTDKTALLLHDVQGLNSELFQLAELVLDAGYRVMIPDWKSAFDTDASQERGHTPFRTFFEDVPHEDLFACLEEVLQHAHRGPSSGDAVLVIGTGWGGEQAFELATRSTSQQATIVIDGSGPNRAALCARITSPVHGFYGAGSGETVTIQVQQLTKYMRASGKTFDPVVYESAQPGFMLRKAELQTYGSQRQREGALTRLQHILAMY